MQTNTTILYKNTVRGTELRDEAPFAAGSCSLSSRSEVDSYDQRSMQYNTTFLYNHSV